MDISYKDSCGRIKKNTNEYQKYKVKIVHFSNISFNFLHYSFLTRNGWMIINSYNFCGN